MSYFTSTNLATNFEWNYKQYSDEVQKIFLGEVAVKWDNIKNDFIYELSTKPTKAQIDKVITMNRDLYAKIRAIVQYNEVVQDASDAREIVEQYFTLHVQYTLDGYALISIPVNCSNF